MKAFRIIDPLVSIGRYFSKRPSIPQGVLLTSFGGIGDQFLFALHIKRFLTLLKPNESLTLLMRTDAKAAAFLYPKEINLQFIDFKKLKRSTYRSMIAKMLYKQHYRLAISCDQLRSPDSDDFLIAAAKADKSYAMIPLPCKKRHRKMQSRLKQYHKLYHPDKNIIDKIDRWNRFINWLTNTTQPTPDVSFSNDNNNQEKLIILSPFSGNRLKNYAPEIFLRTIDFLPEDYQIVLCAHQNDIKNNPDFSALFTHPRIQIDTTHYEQQINLIKKASLILTVDTAFMHLAVAYNAPTICLMSSAYLGEFPNYPKTKPYVKFIYNDISCQGCLGQCIRPIKNNRYPCIDLMKPSDIIHTIKTTLEKYVSC